MFIRLENVYYSYFQNTPFEVQALKNVTLTIDRGESVGIIGRTGCGKSTLIQHFNALLFPAQGSVFIDDEKVQKKGSRLKGIRSKIGLVFQYPEHQIFEETVFDEVAFGPRNNGVSGESLEVTVKWALESVGLDYQELNKKNPFELSGGQMRRVAIASILSMRPEALILDEPTAGLDPEGKRLILGKLKSLREENGTTLILVSHSMDDLAMIAERIIVMDKGTIGLDGPVRQIFSQGEVIERYGIKPPTTAQIAELLRKKGFDIGEGILTAQELSEQIEEKILNGGCQ
ncbi:energy-coupling factor transporter ATPase [Atribacter laminatus]|uniref:Energy-coupling factor transporter ATP-binding protein EcfA2 n=1 Tax=Atribacter laminatus TaxID=2847778 RepID=A0A7T1F4C8_ATRLM|nr:energy-coupling factor transporter ATPase [Atribacter laminatus]QPM69361.1 Energy-coupling factor transporter ATP-binding protein EcfA2 [Atribacter laminatus]